MGLLGGVPARPGTTTAPVPPAATAHRSLPPRLPRPQIAKGYKLNLTELLAANPKITNPDLIFQGEVIKIPWCARQDVHSRASRCICLLAPRAPRASLLRTPPGCLAQPASPVWPSPALPGPQLPPNAHPLRKRPPSRTTRPAALAAPPSPPPSLCSRSEEKGDNVLDLLEHRNDTTLLTQLIYAADLQDTLASIDEGATLFAPNDAAVEALIEKLGGNTTEILANKDLLTSEAGAGTGWGAASARRAHAQPALRAQRKPCARPLRSHCSLPPLPLPLPQRC